MSPAKASESKQDAGSLPVISVKINSFACSLSEISQTKSVRYAFLTGETTMTDGEHLETFHPLVKCRDFLTDVLVSKDEQREMCVYGFSITPSKNKLQDDAVKLLLQLPNKQDRDALIRNFPSLNRIEKQYFPKVSPSELFLVKGEELFLAVKGDVYFQKTSYLLSLYTFWIRLSLYFKDPSDDWLTYTSLPNLKGLDTPRDIAYMKHMVEEQNLTNVLPVLSEIDITETPTVTGFAKGSQAYSVHEYGGIQSLLGMVANPRFAESGCSVFATQIRKKLEKKSA